MKDMQGMETQRFYGKYYATVAVKSTQFFTGLSSTNYGLSDKSLPTVSFWSSSSQFNTKNLVSWTQNVDFGKHIHT